MKHTRRFCLTLDLKNDPALIEEYKHWHKQENIWPEIPQGIASAGIVNMEIYLLGTRLFMIIEAGHGFDFGRDMAMLATLPRQKEWEEFVSVFQATSPDAVSNGKWKLMEKIFQLNP
jgi:L-rhamnose mutarotase